MPSYYTRTHTYAHMYTQKKGKDGHRRRHLDQGTLCQKNVSLLRFARRRHYTTTVVVVACCIQTTKTSAKGARGSHQMSCETFRTKLYFCNSLTAAQDS